MMTRIKLNYYRAEDEMLVIERIKWRKEEEERKKQWKLKEKELAKLRLQVTSNIFENYFRRFHS